MLGARCRPHWCAGKASNAAPGRFYFLAALGVLTEIATASTKVAST